MPNKNILSQKQGDELIKKTHEKKEFELFDVYPAIPPRRNDQSMQTRLANWEEHLKEVGITTDDFWVSKNPENENALYLCFANGLRIEDYDKQGVSFWANEDKDTLNKNKDSVIKTIRVAANHLYRRGDYVMEGKNLTGSDYPGSEPYTKAFKQAYSEAQNAVLKEELNKLAHQK